MRDHLNRGVRDVITDYPEVGRILEAFGVGCTTCALGSCLLKDLVGIHNLNPDVEADLMYRIECSIYPDRIVKRRQTAVLTEPEAKPNRFSPPLQSLVDEHKAIKRWLFLIPSVVSALNKGATDVWPIVEGGASLMKEYADRLHHAKEEEILFSYVDRSSEIIQVMCQDHVHGREHRRMISEAILGQKSVQAAEHLMAYCELLTAHIKREDEILFPWVDRSLSMSQVGELHGLFTGVDAKAAEEVRKHMDFLKSAEVWAADRE